MAVDIGIRIKADNMTGRDFDKLVGDLKRTGTTTEQVSRSAKGFGNRLGDMRSQLRNVALGAGAFTAALGLVGKSFVTAAIEMEGIKNGMIALEGSAEAAEARFSSLREVIRQPGVGYQDAVKAAVQLKAVRLEAELADRTIREFGNALALVGRTDLNETMLGLRQMLSRGRVSQEELNQITERSPIVATVLEEQFGSVLSEDIQAQIDAAGKSITDGFLIPLLEGLEDLERAPVDSTMNRIQNLHSSVFELKAGLGDALLPTVNSIVKVLTSAVEAFNEMDDGVKSAIVTVGAIVTGLGALATAASAVGYVIGGIKTLLAAITGASGLAGLGALLAPAAPVLAGIAAFVAVSFGFIFSLKETAEVTRFAREQDELFAEQLKETEKVLESGKGFDARIAKLQEYITMLEKVITHEQRRRRAAYRTAETRSLGSPEDRKNPYSGPELTDSEINRLKTSSESESKAARNKADAELLLDILIQVQNSSKLTTEQLKELERTIESAKDRVLKAGNPNQDLLKTLEAAYESVGKKIKQIESAATLASRKQTLNSRNFRLEIVELNAVLDKARENFKNVTNVSELDNATSNLYSALDAVNQVRQEEIQAELNLERAAQASLTAKEKATSSHVKRIQYLEAQLRQVQLTNEKEITDIKDEETQKRTRFEKEAQREAAKSIVPIRNFKLEFIQLNHELFKARDAFNFDVTNLAGLDSAVSLLYSALDAVRQLRIAQIDDQIATEKADFSGLTESEQKEAHSAHLQRIKDLNAERLQVQVDFEQNKTRIQREEGQKRAQLEYEAEQERLIKSQRTNAVELAVGLAQSTVGAVELAVKAAQDAQDATLDRLEAGQEERDRRFEEENRAAAAAWQESENRWIQAARAYVKRLRRQQPFSRERLSEDTGNLVASVPLDVIDAVTSNFQIRRDGNAEIIELEQETAAEIQSIQESVTLSAEEKAREIERIERQSALRRIQIENQVSELQRASFQSVVTDFLTGIARMIAAEAQLALARRATSALSGLFGGGGAAAGGVGLLGGVFLPLLGGLGLAYGASQLIGHSSPSAEVHQRSHYGAVNGSGGDRTPTVQPTSGRTRISQEDGTPTLEANLNVTVEASGTRLGQANERVKLKTARWGG